MPCDYNKYPENWKTEIRPAILERDGHRCKFCKVPDKMPIFRGIYDGCEVYQTIEGDIFHYPKGEFWGRNEYAAIEPLSGNENQKAIKVVLTIMHLDHDTNNNEYENLAAACQKCHLTYDKEYHRKNAKETNDKKKGLQKLF